MAFLDPVVTRPAAARTACDDLFGAARIDPRTDDARRRGQAFPLIAIGGLGIAFFERGKPFRSHWLRGRDGWREAP